MSACRSFDCRRCLDRTSARRSAKCVETSRTPAGTSPTRAARSTFQGRPLQGRVPKGRCLAEGRVQGVRQCGRGGRRSQVTIADPVHHRRPRDARPGRLGAAQLPRRRACVPRRRRPGSASMSSGWAKTWTLMSRGRSTPRSPCRSSRRPTRIQSGSNSPYNEPPSDLPNGLGSPADEVARA